MLANVPDNYSVEQSTGDCTQIVSLRDFVSERSHFIVTYLGFNFIQDYEQIDHEFGIFDTSV